MASSQSQSRMGVPPVAAKTNMDKDYDYYIAKYNTQQPPPPPPNPPRSSKYQSNLGVVPMEPVMEQIAMGAPPRPPASLSPLDKADPHGASPDENVDGDEALLDLAQLEELHHEAERMKALGNKHMAAQEYTRAYNAYSAALQLSPVGPSSHVFLSNRSAALLSLKRYSAAATDARRAIVLAPTFGKAHARLGQALYFLKDYEGAVTAYEDAIHYEPDNPITKTYLEKAKTKWDRQREKQVRSARGEEVSVLTETSSVQATVINSVATDPNAQAAVVQSMGYRGQSNAMTKAVGGAISQNVSVADTLNTNEEDPDFEEALRIQERANRYLANKNYKYAIEEYTAALFLVPDDYNLSPDLHLGRAHALNGSRRHESAKIDASLAIKIKPSPEAYSTLAKSLFYMKDYQGAIDAFGRCRDMLPEGESLSMFDRAYLQKSEAALQEALQSEESPSPPRTPMSSTTPIPKLRPPRFVPREEALNRAPNIPSMPKSWPQQSPRDAQVLQCAQEREVLFLSEALGIKLNRGPDGVVRVIDVSPEVPGSPIARQGQIDVGDVIREAAGVDLRRPITNIMWGDTVALIKMAPRPIVLVVAEELNPGPAGIAEQRKSAAANALSPTSAAEYFPSNSSGDESVKGSMEQTSATSIDDTQEEAEGLNETPLDVNPVVVELRDMETKDLAGTRKSGEDGDAADMEKPSDSTKTKKTTQDLDTATAYEKTVLPKNQAASTTGGEEVISLTQASENNDLPALPGVSDGTPCADIESANAKEIWQVRQKASTSLPVEEAEKVNICQPPLSLRDEESGKLGAEIVFHREAKSAYCGWDNLRWMSYSGTRKVRLFGSVYRFAAGRRTLFWSGNQYLDRKLAVYDEPSLLLILRLPESLSELREIMNLPIGASIEDADQAMESYLVVESVVDPNTCKLRLSPLTALTSILPNGAEDDPRRRSCFELLNPVESIVLSAVQLRNGAERALTSFTDSGAFLETSTLEHALQKSICDAHLSNEELRKSLDLSWKHQIILGTLHSFAVVGNESLLERAIDAAKCGSVNNNLGESNFLDPIIIDAKDDCGRTALHYACFARFSAGVVLLIQAGANVDMRTEPYNMTPCHICAMNLDSKSLEAILKSNRRPNVVDSWSRTPSYLAIMDGRSVGGMKNAAALDSTLSVLESHGGQVEAPMGFRHPVSDLASLWSPDELSAVMRHVNYRYPLALPEGDDKRRIGISISAFYQYPIHSALITLRKRIKIAKEANKDRETSDDWTLSEKNLVQTLKVLLRCGFEPNERLEALLENFDGFEELAIHIGFAPIQILAAAALDASSGKDKLGGAIYISIMNLIANTTEHLVKNGGRLSLAPPPAERSKDRVIQSMMDASTGSEDGGEDVQPIDRCHLKIQSNKQLAGLLGVLRLSAVESTWRESKAVSSSGTSFFHTDKLAIEDSQAPGGSDVKSCATCWKVFGTLTNRKHRCRISRRHVCDECSSKRILENDDEHRVSDGQFLLARADIEAAEARKQENTCQEFDRSTQQQSCATTSRLDRFEAQEAANRDSLFGNVMGNMAKAVFGQDGDGPFESNGDSIQGLNNALNQTRDQLNQRGEKLNTLADKSDRLVHASKDFASMAKELSKQSEGGFFW